MKIVYPHTQESPVLKDGDGLGYINSSSEKPRSSELGVGVYLLPKLLSLLLLKLFFGFRIEGKRNIPKHGGFILASNHVSNIDPVALGAACPRMLSYMAKEELFRSPVFSWLLSKVGAFPLKRNTVDIWAMKEAIKRVKEGSGLLLFPEGRRRRENQAQKVLAGAGYLALKCNVPVIPAFIKGTDLALPPNARFFRLYNISVKFGRKVFIEKGLSYQDASGKIMAEIKKLA